MHLGFRKRLHGEVIWELIIRWLAHPSHGARRNSPHGVWKPAAWLYNMKRKACQLALNVPQGSFEAL